MGGYNPSLAGPPPPSPSVTGQMGPPRSAIGQAAQAGMPTQALTQELVSIAERIRKVIPGIQQAAPEAMVWVQRGLEAFAQALTALQGGQNPAQGAPSSPPGPLEPRPGAGMSAGPGAEGAPPEF